MKRFLLVLALFVLAGCVWAPGSPDVCRNAFTEGLVVVECVEFGFSEDRSSVFVQLERPVLTASYTADGGAGKCVVSGESRIRCPVAAEDDGRTFVLVAGAVEAGEEVGEFELEVQLS